jgi:hypothetical protein
MSGGGGDVAAIDPSILGGAGTSMGGGWMAAPGMADAGYGLPDPSQAPTWWDRNMPSNEDLSKALKGLGSAGGGGAAAAGKGSGPPMPGQGPSGGVGRPTGMSLTPLLQLLAQRREALMNSATGGVGMGQAQPQGAGRVQGLLGF